MPKVRTTIEPDKELEVTEEEKTDLGRLGVLLETNATTDAGRQRAAVRQTENQES